MQAFFGTYYPYYSVKKKAPGDIPLIIRLKEHQKTQTCICINVNELYTKVALPIDYLIIIIFRTV